METRYAAAGALAAKDDVALQAILLQTFGLTAFRGNQIDAINATILGQDSIVVLPTGGHIAWLETQCLKISRLNLLP